MCLSCVCVCVCIHQDRRGNTIWTPRRNELAKSSSRESERKKETERQQVMCVQVHVYGDHLHDCVSHNVLTGLCSLFHMCPCDRERQSQSKTLVGREREIERHNKRAPRHLENSPMKTQLDGQKFHLSPLFPSSISPFSDHLLTPLNNPFIFFVYFISISLLAISMYALEDGEMREEDKKKEWGLQAKIQQERHVLHFSPPPVCFHCSFNLHPRGQQQHDPDISQSQKT